MLNYIFAIIGLVVLCSSWALLQIWIRKSHSDTAVLKSGCATCSNADCCRER